MLSRYRSERVMFCFVEIDSRIAAWNDAGSSTFEIWNDTTLA